MSDQQPIDATRTLAAFTSLGGTRFSNTCLLGAGAMGEVFSAYDNKLRRKVALKRIQRRLMANDEIGKRLERELFLHARVGMHQHIVALLERIEEGDEVLLVLEYVDGLTLKQFLQRHLAEGNLVPPPVALRIGAQILDALVRLHSHKVIHRDIKPANVMVSETEDGELHCKLLDFGIAMDQSHETAQLTHDRNHSPGTPMYMAPEQIDASQFGGAVTPAADLYAVGITLYELIVGKPPFGGELAMVYNAHLFRPPQRPALADTDPKVEAAWQLIERALQKQPGDRFVSAKAMRDACRDLADEIEGRVTTPRVSTDPQPRIPLSPANAPPSASTPGSGTGSGTGGASGSGAGSRPGTNPAAGSDPRVASGSGAGAPPPAVPPPPRKKGGCGRIILVLILLLVLGFILLVIGIGVAVYVIGPDKLKEYVNVSVEIDGLDGPETPDGPAVDPTPTPQPTPTPGSLVVSATPTPAPLATLAAPSPTPSNPLTQRPTPTPRPTLTPRPAPTPRPTPTPAPTPTPEPTDDPRATLAEQQLVKTGELIDALSQKFLAFSDTIDAGDWASEPLVDAVDTLEEKIDDQMAAMDEAYDAGRWDDVLAMGATAETQAKLAERVLASTTELKKAADFLTSKSLSIARTKQYKTATDLIIQACTSSAAADETTTQAKLDQAAAELAAIRKLGW